MNPYIKSLGFTDIMSDSDEKTPTISPDKGATGETATSSKTMAAGMQTGLSEEEKEAHLLEVEWNAILRMLNSIKARDREAYWDIIIGALYKHFTRENRAKRSKEEIFLELDQLEVLETEYLETSGHVPDWLKGDMKHAQGEVEFENYVTLLKEARACFGHGIECIIISYIDKQKGEHYCMNCMRHSD